MELLDRPLIQAAMMIAAIVLAFGFVILRGSRKVEREDLPGLAGLLARGEYEQAGNLAARYGRLDEAIDYYLRAQLPVRAAHVAVKLSDARRAAELFERAGEHERAAFYYDQADMGDKARIPRDEEVDRSAEEEPTDEPERASRSERRQARSEESAADSGSEEREGLREPETPSKPAAFTAAAAEDTEKANSAEPRSTDAGEADGNHESDAAAAADELFRSGDLRKAADAYRDAGLYEEAIHLYANLLGLPEEAASLLEKTGNPDRAAELRSLAKQAAQSSVPAESTPREAPSTAESQPLPFGERVGTSPSPPPSAVPEVPSSSENLPDGWQLPASAGSAGDKGTLTRTSEPPAPIARASDRTLAFGEQARNFVAQARAAYSESPVARRRKREQSAESDPPPSGKRTQEPAREEDEPPSPADRRKRSWSPPFSRTKR